MPVETVCGYCGRRHPPSQYCGNADPNLNLRGLTEPKLNSTSEK